MPLGKRLLLSLAITLGVSLVVWAVKDIWFGEWVRVPGWVTGKQYVAAYVSNYTYSCGEGRTCMGTTYHPPKYMVFVLLNDGTVDEFNDRDVFGRHIGPPLPVVVRYRQGRSGVRWFGAIE